MNYNYYKLTNSGIIRLVRQDKRMELEKLTDKGYIYELDTFGRKKVFNSEGKQVKQRKKVEDDFLVGDEDA